MEILNSIPALVKILTVFFFVVVLIRLKIHITISLFIGSIILGLFFNMGIVSITVTILREISRSAVILLALVIFLILLLSYLMKETGIISGMVSSFSGIAGSRRLTAATFPAIIGLLPMPGGAVFSAPMVEKYDEASKLAPETKTAVNYWFRHIWEYWWPLYPGVLLAVFVFKIELLTYIAYAFPLTLVAVLGGFIFIFRGIKEKLPAIKERKGMRIFIMSIMPIILVIGGLIIFEMVVRIIQTVKPFQLENIKYIRIIFGLLLAVAYVIKIKSIRIQSFRMFFSNIKNYLILSLIFGVSAFTGILQGSGGIEQVLIEMDKWGIPPILLFISMPFLTGFITGLAIGFVGLSFPLVYALYSGYFGEQSVYAYAILAYGFGYMGMMTSPLHVCLILTCDYFKAKYRGVYKILLLPVILVLAATVGLFFLYRLI
ncbi:DUF401 family protein [Spirochaetota bacterium]